MERIQNNTTEKGGAIQYLGSSISNLIVNNPIARCRNRATELMAEEKERERKGAAIRVDKVRRSIPIAILGKISREDHINQWLDSPERRDSEW